MTIAIIHIKSGLILQKVKYHNEYFVDRFYSFANVVSTYPNPNQLIPNRPYNRPNLSQSNIG